MSTSRDVNLTTTPETQGPREYVVLAPDGKHVVVKKELFDALLLMSKQNAGTIEIQCKNGGICGVEVAFKMK